MRARRLAAGFSQTELCLAAKCSLSSVQIIDRGYVPVWRSPGDVLERIEAVLGAALNEPATHEGRAANATLAETTDTDSARDRLSAA